MEVESVMIASTMTVWAARLSVVAAAGMLLAACQTAGDCPVGSPCWENARSVQSAFQDAGEG